MTADDSMQVEKLAADRILNKGVRIAMRAPFFMRWIGKKTVSLTIRSPYEGTMHRVASYYLSTGIKLEQLENITHEESLALMVAHGGTLTKAVACAWLNGYWSGKWLTKPLAAYMRWHCMPEQIATIATMLLIYGGTSDFINITRSVRMMKITAPRTGQQDQGS